MIKYEHKLVTVHTLFESTQETLNMYEEQGWELVTVIRLTNIRELYFKRAI